MRLDISEAITRAERMPMIASVTRSSIIVKPLLVERSEDNAIKIK
jgi:hypothetical protein